MKIQVENIAFIQVISYLTYKAYDYYNLYKIYLPRFSSCISLNTTSVFPSEKEILLPPASLFLITEMKHRSSLQKDDPDYDLKFRYGYIYKLLYIGSAVDYIFKTRFPQQYEKE